MVVTETMQYSVRDEIAHFATYRMSEVRGLLFRPFLADADTAHKQPSVFFVNVARIVVYIDRFTSYAVVVRERQYVGNGVFTALVPVERAYFVFADESDFYRERSALVSILPAASATVCKG